MEKSIPVDIPKEWSDNSKVSDLKVTFYLLDMIKDEKIAALVKEAMVNNHDLKATILRLKAANFLVNGSRSVFDGSPCPRPGSWHLGLYLRLCLGSSPDSFSDSGKA